MKPRKKWMALLLAAAMLLTLAACGGKGGTEAPPEAGTQASPSPSPSAGPDTGAEEKGIALSMGSEPAYLDPTRNRDAQGTILLSHLFEGLMKWSDSGKDLGGGVHAAQLAPGMAESYERVEVDEDIVTYTFHLRAGAKWSDGKPVTAQDFVYAWQRAADPASGAGYADLMECVLNADAIRAGYAQASDLAVRAVDEATFEVAVHDVAWFLELCALPVTAPLRQDALEEAGNQWGYDPAGFVCNGPYVLKSRSVNAQVVLEKNPAYYEPVAGPETITVYFESDAGAVAGAFEDGRLDAALGVGGDGAVRLPYTGSYYLCFQTQRAPFDDPLVRQAFNLAIDREGIAEKLGTGQVPAGGLVPGGVWDAGGAGEKDFRAVAGDYVDPAAFKANCDKARALLSQAGYPEGKDFPEAEYLYPANAVHRAVAEALRDTWQKELGVTVTLKEKDWGEFLTDSHQGNFSIARGRWVADYNDPASFLDLWRGGENDAKYENAAYDDFVDRAEKALDQPARRMELLRQAEGLLVGRDHVVAPVYFEGTTCLLAKGLKGVYYTPLGYFFFSRCEKR